MIYANVAVDHCLDSLMKMLKATLDVSIADVFRHPQASKNLLQRSKPSMRIRYAIALITITIAAVMLTAGVVAAKPIIKPACRYTAYRHYCLIENIKGHKLTFRTLVCHGVIYLGKHQLLTGTGCVNSR